MSKEGSEAQGALPQYLYGLEVDLNNNVTMSKIELRDPIRYSYVIDADLVMFQKQPANYNRKYSWNVVYRQVRPCRQCLRGQPAVFYVTVGNYGIV